MAPKPFLTAEWRYLVMLNYEVDQAALAPFLPGGVELDDWRGRTFASLVGFLFLDTRLLAVPIPFHRDFEEVNLRFYVRQEAGGELRRGVVFVKEIVPRPAIALTARLVYGERYVSLPMRHRIETAGMADGAGGRFIYEWRFAGVWNRLWARAQGEPVLPLPGSEEEFITEHYWGYARRRDGGTVAYQVEHPPWQVWRAAECGAEVDIRAQYGPAFRDALSLPPSSAFVAAGSPVTVYRGALLPSPG